jgi:hypothetical protein
MLSPKETTMATLQVFDKPMCCSTGICGPKVDPVLPKFASDLAWLKDQGVAVERFNLAQQPQVFVSHPDVKDATRENHELALPLVLVNGVIVSRGTYPDDAFFEAATRGLHDRFEIEHVTLQVIRVPFTAPCARKP